MSHLFQCSNGHEWQATDDEETPACPLCGSQAGGDDPTYVGDEFPPLPRASAPLPGLFESAASIDARFRIVRLHAKGGLGQVYVAHDEELHREVALKEIQGRHADNPASRARFLLEAEVTGGLEHPGIVPVYSLGQHGDGRPYYAMRFIRGDSMHDAIKRFHSSESGALATGEHALDLRKLLGRFIAVCEAIQYAHDRGVLHRDLKPDNIMLGRYGETLVVDWGLAKVASRGASASGCGAEESLLHPVSAGGSAETVAGSVVGTPAYMSPEQAAGRLDQLGPASDVYSLGATLFCLLTGNPPLGGTDVAASLAKARTGDFPRLRQIKPDVDPALEAICLKAMSAQPEDRYRSPRALADDLEHWLADKPVSAWPEPWTVRTRRWLGAHRTLVTGTAAALCVGLVSLLVATLLLSNANEKLSAESVKVKNANDKLAEESEQTKKHARRAEMNFAQARQAVNRLTQVAKKKLGHLPRMEQEQRAILLEAHKFFQELPAEDLRKPSIQADLGKLYGLLGNVELLFGNLDRAEDLVAKELKIQGRLATDDPAPEHLDRLAHALNDLADLYGRMDLHEKSEETHRRILTLREKLTKENPGQAKFQASLATEHYNLALALIEMDRTEEAEPSYQRAITLLEKLANEPGVEAQVQDNLSGAHLSLGSVHKRLGRFVEAEKSYLAALACKDKLASLDADWAARSYVRLETRRTCTQLGIVRRSVGNLAGAEQAYRKALAVAKKLAEDFPSVPDFYLDLGTSYADLTSLLAETGQPTAELNKQALEHWRRFPDLLQAKSAHRAEQARLLVSWAERLVAAGDYAEAEKNFRQTLALSQKLHDDFPAIPRYRRDVAFAWHNIGVALQNQGKLDEAGSAYRQAIARHEKLAEDLAALPEARINLAEARASLSQLLVHQRQPSQAEDLLRRNVALREKLAQDYPHIPGYREALGLEMDSLRNILTPMGRVQEAEKQQRRELAVFESLAAEFPAVHRYRYFVADDLFILAALLQGQGRSDEAEKLDRQALALRQKLAEELPTIPRHQQALGTSHINLGIVLEESNRSTQAETEYTQAQKIFEDLYKRFPDNAGYASDLAATCNSLGNTWRTLKQPLKAKAAWEQALQLQEKMVADHPDRPDFRHELATSHGNMGLLLEHDLKKPRDAAQAYRAGLKILTVLVEQYPTVVQYRALLGEHHGRLGMLLQFDEDYAHARTHLEKSVRQLRQALQANPAQPRTDGHLRANYQEWIVVLIALNDDEAAAKAARELAAWLPEKNEGAFLAAKFLCWGTYLLDEDDWVAEKERRRRVDFLGEQTVALLQKAPPADAKSLQEMKTSSLFQLLRKRDDFKLLLEKVSR